MYLVVVEWRGVAVSVDGLLVNHAVQLVRCALYVQFEPVACAVVVGVGLAFFGMAVVAYDPGRGIMARRGGPAGDNT